MKIEKVLWIGFYLTGTQLFVKQGSPITGPEIIGSPQLPEPPPVNRVIKSQI
jgi:hypothetical protein